MDGQVRRIAAARVVVANGLLSRLRGLFAYGVDEGVLVVLDPCNDIHTYGMSRPIDVAFASADGVVVEVHRGVPPFRRLRCPKAAMTCERYAAPDACWFEVADRIGDIVCRIDGGNEGR